MKNKDLRELAILILDDGNGIGDEAVNKLKEMLTEANCSDIVEQIEVSNNRHFIGEDFAEEALRDLSKWEEAEVTEEPEAENISSI